MKVISGENFCKLLEKNGWVLKRTTKSSHFIYANTAKAGIILSVPVHANRDLKGAGLSEADL
jgi:predicted RNA binding protein YcfA (HicA-like mRNA interferase family)